jgi:hypothetical protein
MVVLEVEVTPLYLSYGVATSLEPHSNGRSEVFMIHSISHYLSKAYPIDPQVKPTNK